MIPSEASRPSSKKISPSASDGGQHAYLDPAIRAGISTFHLPGAEALLGGLDQLDADLETGRWMQRNHEILERTELDLGYRLLVAQA